MCSHEWMPQAFEMVTRPEYYLKCAQVTVFQMASAEEMLFVTFAWWCSHQNVRVKVDDQRFLSGRLTFSVLLMARRKFQTNQGQQTNTACRHLR